MLYYTITWHAMIWYDIMDEDKMKLIDFGFCCYWKEGDKPMTRRSRRVLLLIIIISISMIHLITIIQRGLGLSCVTDLVSTGGLLQTCQTSPNAFWKWLFSFWQKLFLSDKTAVLLSKQAEGCQMGARYEVDPVELPCGPRGLFFRSQGPRNRPFEHKHVNNHWSCNVNPAS